MAAPPVAALNEAALEAAAAAAERQPSGEPGTAAGGAAAAARTAAAGGQGSKRYEHQSSSGSGGTQRSTASTHRFSIASSAEVAAAQAAAAALAAVQEEAAAAPPAPPSALQRAAEAAQAPFVLLLQATVPLAEPNAYSRPWFLRSLAASPLFIVLYWELLSWQVRCALSGGGGGRAASACLQCNAPEAPCPPSAGRVTTRAPPCPAALPQAVLVALGAGGALCAAGAAGTRGLGGKAPLWTFGTDYPIGGRLFPPFPALASCCSCTAPTPAADCAALTPGPCLPRPLPWA